MSKPCKLAEKMLEQSDNGFLMEEMWGLIYEYDTHPDDETVGGREAKIDAINTKMEQIYRAAHDADVTFVDQKLSSVREVVKPFADKYDFANVLRPVDFTSSDQGAADIRYEQFRRAAHLYESLKEG